MCTDCARICYGMAPTRAQDIAIDCAYVPRPASVPLHPPLQVYIQPTPVYDKLGLASIPCFFASGTRPDWLGEIFEWLSCADEYAITERDEAGRIPFNATIHGRFNLDPCVPYAGVAMYELNRSIREAFDRSWPDRTSSPAGLDEVVVAATHDLDFLPINAWANAKRLSKNIAIAALHFRDPKLTLCIAGATVRGIVTGKSPLNYLDEMVIREATEQTRSTYNVICHRGHVRDANYELDEANVQRMLRFIADNGMEIGLHGSYTSLEGGGLKFEFERLAAAGYRASGLRQHWLRFAGDKLFEQVASLGLSYDSTVGFAEHVGFRAGACFPYQPYDFRRERAYPFVEIPLVIMDVALYEHAKRTGASARSLCSRVLDMVEAFGWGGVAILWHNTVFGGGQLPADIGELYWELKRPYHKWVSCRDVAAMTKPLNGQKGADPSC
jgi:hypothetical protein